MIYLSTKELVAVVVLILSAAAILVTMALVALDLLGWIEVLP